eukprot:1212960-Amphidinium_carterae.1
MRLLATLRLFSNHFSKSLPGDGVAGIATNMRAIGMETNRFTGSLPEEGLRRMTLVFLFWIGDNQFSKTLPADGMRGLASSLEELYIYMNRFQGSLPVDGTQALIQLSKMDLQRNQFTSSLPHRGVSQMVALE